MHPPRRGGRGKEPIEVRRSKGEISCAECRRHKLKCDKSIPCSTCIRKGCPSICPNGTLSSGHGSRNNAVDVDILNHKITEMGKRIHQLEDALQICHSSISTGTHPLLAEDLLEIKSGAILAQKGEVESDSAEGGLVESFGMLSVSERGTEAYLSGFDAIFSTNGLDPLGTAEPKLESPKGADLPPQVSYVSETFPFSPVYLPMLEIQALVEAKLPSFERASALIEAYLQNLSWFFRPVDREQITEELIPEVYRRRRSSSTSSASPANSPGSSSSASADTQIDAHMLALLLAVFACGAAADMTLPPWNDEADLYYHLARTALSLKPVFDGASLHAVQAIAIIGAYDLFACRKNELEGTWKMMSFSMSLAASIGLNRDPSHFKLSPKLIQRRRRVFWELYTIDTWKSIGTGRPTTFTPSVVDVEFPEDSDVDGSELTSFWQIRYRFVKEVLTDMVEILCSTRPVKYSEIVRLDRRIREFGPHKLFNSLATTTPDPGDFDGGIKSAICFAQLSMLKDISNLLILHRSFFSRAIIDNPTDPLRSQFAPSFLSIYRSASTLLRIVHEQFEHCAHFLMRLWPVWGHALVASVMLGSVAACGSASAMAPQAYAEFEIGLKMFAQVHMHPLVKKAMPMLMRLRDRAQQALSRQGHIVISHQPSPPVTQQVPNNETQNVFNVVNSLGQLIRKGAEGSFGYVHQPISHFLDNATPVAPRRIKSSRPSEIFSESVFSPSIFAPDQPGQPLLHGESSSGLNPQNTIGGGTLGSTVAASSDYIHPSPQSANCHPPPPPGSGEASGCSSNTGQDINEPLHPSLMQVDGNLYPSMGHAQGVDERLYNPPQAGNSGTSYGDDALEAFANYMNVDASVSSFDPSNPFMQPGSHQEQNAYPASLPALFPTSDFDVTFDMRAPTDEENIASMLPQDLEAWRTILHDSRYFGFPDTESVKENL